MSSPRLVHRYADELPELAVDWTAGAVSDPDLVVVNTALATELGIDVDWLRSDAGRALLTGTVLPDGARPVAMAYAGHQFGGYSPQLGDGRALLLGELEVDGGRLVDLHLKGSGRTPFARGGDGRATLPSMLREYLIAEAMHALGVPTTRALAVVTTGDAVVREQAFPGAVLTRVASSHLRVGTFQFAAARSGDDPELVRRLADHAIDRHYPELRDRDDRYAGLLEAVIEAQASLVASWMAIGFIHGVMNTDNLLVSGATIDYGPCAFVDRYDPATVFSSIDHGGRYAFGNQPSMAQWGLARFAETLLALIDDDQDAAVATATELLHTFPARFIGHWHAAMRSKLGLTPDAGTNAADDAASGIDAELFDDLLALLHEAQADYTLAFRHLADLLRGDDAPLRALVVDPGLDAWLGRWLQRLESEDGDAAAIADAMDCVNPVHIPRNHLVEAALASAADGDLAEFTELFDAVTAPFDRRGADDRFAMPPPEEFTASYRTYCGT